MHIKIHTVLNKQCTAVKHFTTSLHLNFNSTSSLSSTLLTDNCGLLQFHSDTSAAASHYELLNTCNETNNSTSIALQREHSTSATHFI